MNHIKKVISLSIISIIFAQSPTETVEGSHTLTKIDGVGIYEAIDLCLKQAIINGVFDYLNSKNDFSDEKKSEILSKLAPVVEMCVMEPSIIEQTIDGNTIFIRAKGQVDPMILNSILGLE